MAVTKSAPGAKPSKLDALERVEVISRAEWRAWLKKHHSRREGIWLVTWKKATPAKHLPYASIVEEALCYGWIDSLPRKLNEERTMLYVCPRKPKSVWSKLNKERIIRLEAEGRMTAIGRAKIDGAKADGSWTTLDAVEALEEPFDLTRALAKNKIARDRFDAFPPGSRKIILQWINSAKTAITRTKRINEAVALAAKNIRANQPKT